jgi:hypothetical protein
VKLWRDLLSACADRSPHRRLAGKNQPADRSLHEAVVSDATITKFDAQPRALPAGGGSVTLTWEVEGAFTAISIEGYDGQAVADAKGSATAQITSSSTFTLVVDSVRSDSQTVTVDEQKPPEEKPPEEKPPEEKPPEEKPPEEKPPEEKPPEEKPPEEKPPEEKPPEEKAAGGDAPKFDDVSVDIDPDDGLDHHAHSIQVATDAKLKLSWKTTGAASVGIAELGKDGLDASGSIELPTEIATYTLVAVGPQGEKSEPYSLEIHTHAPEEAVSAHQDLKSGAGGDWTAAWSQTTVKEADKLQMILTAPGLAAGTEVTFEVKQEGYDTPIGTTTATSEDGKASADWSTWFKSEAVAGQQTVNADNGEKFKEVKFSFKASAGGKDATTTALVVFADPLSLSFVDENNAPLAKTRMIVFSPWGTLSVTSDETGNIKLDGLPPGEVSVGIE